MPMGRREFLAATGAAALAGCAGTPGGEGGLIPIVDTHQHLWDLDRFRLPWLSGRGPLAKNHLPSDYLEAFRGTPIAPIKPRVDMEFPTTDQVINFSDAVLVIDAFRGLSYPYAPGADPCP